MQYTRLCDSVIFFPPSREQIGMRLQQQEGIQNGAIWTVHSCKPDCRMGRVIASPNPMPSFLRVSLHVHCIDVRHWIYICWDQVDRF